MYQFFFVVELPTFESVEKRERERQTQNKVALMSKPYCLLQGRQGQDN